MNMIPVVSSNLSSAGYENGNLYITFHGNRTYVYFDVPEYVYTELLNAESKGKYHARFIKNSYRYQQL